MHIEQLSLYVSQLLCHHTPEILSLSETRGCLIRVIDDHLRKSVYENTGIKLHGFLSLILPEVLTDLKNDFEEVGAHGPHGYHLCPSL